MFTLDAIRKFHGWTHASLDLLLDHLSALSPGEYVRELPGFGRGSVRDQVVHIFNCEGFWISKLQGFEFVRPNPADYATVADSRRLQQEFTARTSAYVSGLTDTALNIDTELRFSDGDIDIRTPALILHHVLTHAFHHKGQIVAMCRLLGHPAPDTDLNQFT